ncbi:MAG: hypothetical protein JEZ12_28040 [Desulfobacterium sp.]|nr:hypothetical protein [Desulfobacterium sp.]
MDTKITTITHQGEVKEMKERTADFPNSPAEVFSVIAGTLGTTFLIKEAKMTRQTIGRWCASKETHGETRRNPLHFVELIIEELMARGNDDIAIAIADRIAKRVGAELSFKNATPDKDSFLAETIDVHSAVNRFHVLAQDKLEGGKPSTEEIRIAKAYAHQQIDEAFAAFEQQDGKS